MSTTIDSLAIQISSDIGNADIKIDALAKSLEKLKASAGLTKVSNSLNKLSDALGKLKPALSGLEVSKLHALGTTMQGLAGIQKLTGLSNALNTLKKLPEVVGGLDAVDFDKFTTQMRKMSIALGPVATKINSITSGFSKLPSHVNKATSANNKMVQSEEKLDDALDATNISLMARLSNLSAMIGGIQSVIQTMAGFLSQAIEWDGIQFRFGQSFGEDAQEVYDWIVKINEALGINIQEFMQYSGLYASLLNGFGLAQDKVTEIAVGLTELSYDIWAFSNDRFKTLEDASEAIRSAITGEIEPIRNAGIALTEASLQEFIDSTHLAGISIEKLTEAQKAEVRYAAMVNSTMSQGIIGTYAREMNTAEGTVRQLSQSLKTLVQAFGSLFIPILQRVVPIVTAFVEIITDAVFWVANLFGIKIQALDWSKTSKGVSGLADGAKDAATGLGGAAKAAKALKNYTMGFDELNVIDPNSGSGSGGAGGAGGAADWGSGLDLKSLWDEALLDQASKKVDEIKEKIKGFFGDWKTQLVMAVSSVGVLYAAWKKLDSLFDISKKVKLIPALFHKSWFANFASGLKMLKNGHISFKDFLAGITGGMKTQNFASSAKDLVIRLGGALKTALTKLPTILVNAVKAIPVWGWVITAIAAVLTLAIVDYDFTDIGYKIGHALGTALKKVGEWLGAAGEWIASVGKSIMSGINAAWEWVKEEFDIKNVFELILLMFNPVACVTKIIPKMIEIGKEVLPGLWQGIKDGWDNFWGNIGEFIDGFVQGFKDALGISSPSKVFAEIGEWIVQGLLNGVSDRWEAVKAWFEETVAPKFTKEYWSDLFNTIVTATKSKLDETKKSMGEKWDDVTSWFNKTIAPKFTKEYWGKKFNTIKDAAKNKLDEVKSTLSEKWSTITSWYDEHVAPKFTKRYWVDMFDGLRAGFVETIKNAVNSGIDMMNNFIGSVNSALNFSWDALKIGGKTIYEGGSIQLFTIPEISRFEKGGFIEDGLFTMNHGEIAGKFSNGKSVVANNEQIIAGVSEGVYQAVVAAMRDSQTGGNEQPVNVYLDGKQIYASVKKMESQRGVSLMGNQLGYVY